jgi:hypothetical protein
MAIHAGAVTARGDGGAKPLSQRAQPTATASSSTSTSSSSTSGSSSTSSGSSDGLVQCDPQGQTLRSAAAAAGASACCMGDGTARVLNVFSRGFDPLEALRQPSAVPLPVPSARLYNNLGEWPLRGLGEDPYLDIRREREDVMPKEQARREAIQQTIKTENAKRKEAESKEAAYLARYAVTSAAP